MTDTTAAVAAKAPGPRQGRQGRHGGDRGVGDRGRDRHRPVDGAALRRHGADRHAQPGSWGLYITMFMFFVGLSAGGLIISSVPKAFGIKGFGGISKVAVMTSIAATVAAIGLVVVDLGQPLRCGSSSPTPTWEAPSCGTSSC